MRVEGEGGTRRPSHIHADREYPMSASGDVTGRLAVGAPHPRTRDL